MTMMPQLLHRWTTAAPLVLTVLLSSGSFWTATPPISVVQAIAPPHPDYLHHEESPYESLAAYRQRHNITFNYQPQHISPRHCRFLTEAQCAADDEAAQVRIAQQKEFRQRQRHLQNSYTTSGTNIKVLALLVRFADHVDRDLPPREYYDELFNGGQGDVNPVGGLSDWYMTNSMGRYDVTFDVQDWVTTLETEEYYSGNNFGLVGADALQEMFMPLLDDLDQSGYDFYDLDSQGWGYFDMLVVVHSGDPAESGPGGDGCDINPPEKRIWSQGVAGAANGWFSSDYSFQVSNYLIVAAYFRPTCSGNPLELGVTAHEYGHGMGGLFDFYDEDFEEPRVPIGGTGRFGIMSNPYGWDGNMMIPGMFQPFNRVWLDWLEPIEIIQDGYYPIQPSEISSQVYVIRQNFPAGEYLYIENKQPLLWDSNFPTGGIVIYKIDDNANKQTNRGYPGHPNWPTDHYQVAVLQADGNYDIEQGNPGDEGDFWLNGMTLGPGGGWPNTDGFSFGNRQQTGITINIVSDSSFVMLFQVTGLG